VRDRQIPHRKTSLDLAIQREREQIVKVFWPFVNHAKIWFNYRRRWCVEDILRFLRKEGLRWGDLSSGLGSHSPLDY
jgi:hypothetical protein